MEAPGIHLHPLFLPISHILSEVLASISSIPLPDKQLCKVKLDRPYEPVITLELKGVEQEANLDRGITDRLRSLPPYIVIGTEQQQQLTESLRCILLIP